MSSPNLPERAAAVSAPSVPGAIIGAFRLLLLGWRRAWVALVIASGAVGVWLHLAADFGRSPGTFLGLAVAWLAGIAATCVLCRLALGRTDAGPRWGGDEWRMVGVWLLTGLLALVLGLLLLILVLCLAYGVAAAGTGFIAAEPASWAAAVDGRGRLVVGAVGVVGAAAIIWVMARVWLAPMATVAKGRVQVLSTWPLTRTVVWRLLAAMVWTGLTPAALLLVVWSAARFARPGEVLAAGAVHLAQGLVVAGIWLPLKVGVMGYFYPRPEADSP